MAISGINGNGVAALIGFLIRKCMSVSPDKLNWPL